MCYYNRPNLVRFALQSIKTQSYKNWEIVFVDDCSDASAIESAKEILQEDFSKKPLVLKNGTTTRKLGKEKTKKIYELFGVCST